MALLNANPNFGRELAVLQSAGISKKSRVEEEFLDIMENSGLSKEEVIHSLSQLMNGAEMEGTKLSAIKLALQLYMHPALVTKEKTAGEGQTINFNFSDSNIQMNNILTPQVNDNGQ